MTFEGKLLGRGYVQGLGRGRIFHNEDSTESLIFRPDKSDASHIIARWRITFIK